MAIRRTVVAVSRHVATPAMHPAQSWRDGWEDGRNGRPLGETNNGYRTVRGDSYSEMLYNDGYNVGSASRRSR